MSSPPSKHLAISRALGQQSTWRNVQGFVLTKALSGFSISIKKNNELH
jgi:hypothetical protein